ncbi:hypothetical protein DSAG12_02165 [Promethearchaeum syntrophicum]|uniref:Uncharacterized protein n=1 Tax=Promethearchaeum syntrophicum TaxID=2594042 RepID=A0A5B9DBI6_9ARCH|nr:hypothetical protein [Candidatus Prometheoarchaeum syntrophicum]QEE16335.1 hypothetical protein DSAG12_02165 [Candidatus Prometheoarchaeum syntrophicum]
MSQILTKYNGNSKNVERSHIEEKVFNLIFHLQLSPIYSRRIVELFENARKTQQFNNIHDKMLLAICFYRLNLEEKLYLSLRTIKTTLDIRATHHLSNHLRLYATFCQELDLKPINHSLNDHIRNICDLVGLSREIQKKAIALSTMIRNNFVLPGEYRTFAITSIYFAANFEDEWLSVDQLDFYFDFISPSVLYDKIKIFEKYMKEYFRRKSQKIELTRREQYFLDEFSVKQRSNFFRRFRSVKN